MNNIKSLHYISLILAGLILLTEKPVYADSVTPLTWHDISLAETLSPFPVPASCALAPYGQVLLKGTIKPAKGQTLQSGDTIAMLPAPCAPTQDTEYFLTFDRNNSAPNMSLVLFAPNGTVTLLETHPVSSHAHGWILNGVTYAK